MPAAWPTSRGVGRGWRCRTSAHYDMPGLLTAVIGSPPRMTQFTVPGLTEQQGAKIVDLLQKQLSTYNDLHLTLKHVHWNVVGPSFIGVHEMIYSQVELLRVYVAQSARRLPELW